MRKQWIHTYDYVSVLVFFVSASDIVRVLYEDDTSNRHEEALRLFDEQINSKYEFVAAARFVLVVTKCDVFCEHFYEWCIKYPNEMSQFKSILTCSFNSVDCASPLDALVKMQQQFAAKQKSNRIIATYYCNLLDGHSAQHIYAQLVHSIVTGEFSNINYAHVRRTGWNWENTRTAFCDIQFMIK